jgi:hypothetical protein
VPTYNGSSVVWATPTGGGGGSSGGTGLTYLLNYSVAGASPTPSGTWEQLSLTPTTTSSVNTGAVTAPNGGVWANLADFVTPVGEPGATTIPPGFWDLNVYLSSNGAAGETQVRLVVGKWDGTTQTDLYTSASTDITDPTNIALYNASVFVPSTVLAANERLTIRVQITRTTANAHEVTGYFEGIYYSHIHTGIGAPGGTGLVKVANGIVQSPASLLYAAYISGAAGGLNGAGKLFVGRTSGNGPAVATLSGGTGITVTNGDGTISIAVDTSAILTVAAAASTYAPLASPALTGTPTAPTATGGTNDTQIATTAFVVAAITAAAYTLPAATTSTLGGVIVGSGLSVSSGTISANVRTVATPLQLSSGNVSFSQQTANTVLAGPTTGASAAPAFRALVAADIAGISPYDLGTFVVGAPSASAILAEWPIPRVAVIAASGHYFYADTLPSTGSVTMSVYKLPSGSTTPVKVFDMTWTAGSSAGTNGKYAGTISNVGALGARTTAAGDMIYLQMGATANSSFTNIGVGIAGTT